MAGTITIGGKTYKVGKDLGAGELEQIANKSGYTTDSIISRAKKQGVSYKAPATFTSPDNTSYQAGGVNSSNTSGGNAQEIWDIMQKGAERLAAIDTGASTLSTEIRAQADLEIAKVDAASRNYGYELGLQGTKYSSDKESEWRQAVANIESKGKLDLQGIINAGLERVATIEKESALGVADLTSSRSLEGTKYQSDTQKQLGQMNLAGSMYGLLGSIFG